MRGSYTPLNLVRRNAKATISARNTSAFSHRAVVKVDVDADVALEMSLGSELFELDLNSDELKVALRAMALVRATRGEGTNEHGDTPLG